MCWTVISRSYTTNALYFSVFFFLLQTPHFCNAFCCVFRAYLCLDFWGAMAEKRNMKISNVFSFHYYFLLQIQKVKNTEKTINNKLSIFSSHAHNLVFSFIKCWVLCVCSHLLCMLLRVANMLLLFCFFSIQYRRNVSGSFYNACSRLYLQWAKIVL